MRLSADFILQLPRKIASGKFLLSYSAKSTNLEEVRLEIWCLHEVCFVPTSDEKQISKKETPKLKLNCL